jgi:hypothetical protein
MLSKVERGSECISIGPIEEFDGADVVVNRDLLRHCSRGQRTFRLVDLEGDRCSALGNEFAR